MSFVLCFLLSWDILSLFWSIVSLFPISIKLSFLIKKKIIIMVDVIYWACGLWSLGFQLERIKSSEAPLSGELTPYNIVPLEAPSLTNAIGFFPEVSWTWIRVGCYFILFSTVFPIILISCIIEWVFLNSKDLQYQLLYSN